MCTLPLLCTRAHVQVTRIARAGYPTRYRHDQFAARYKVLLPEIGAGEEQRKGGHVA